MSVYHLVNSLCKSLLKESCFENSGIDLQTAKKIAFDILLKKSINQNIDVEKVVEEYQFLIFELLLSNNSRNVQDIELFIELLKEKPSDFLQISAFLIKLKNVNSKIEKNEYNFLQLPSTTIKDLTRNKYFSQIPLDQESLSAASINKQGISSRQNQNPNFLSSILELNIGKKDNQLDNLKLKPIKTLSNSVFPSSTQSKNSTASQNLNFYSWENLINDEHSKVEKPFSSDSRNSFISQQILARSKSIEIVTVPSEKLLNDIKLLLIGIESELFKRVNHTLIFQPTKKKICCRDFSDFSQLLPHLLEAGTCFKRLKVYTGKNLFNQNQIFTGFMFQAFCDRIVKFLNYCRDIIYSQEVDSVLELYHNTEKIRRIIIHVSKFLKIHPKTSGDQQPIIPNGSEFLKLLYNEFSNAIHEEMKSFYIELLKACCEVYYLRLQEWFYHGKLEDPHEELFIYFVEHYSINTKYYFDRAYIIRTQSVPSFLAGCADEILLCGKYTELLKSFNAGHPLLRMKKPSFKICLSFDEINTLREMCKTFVKNARLECGEPISIGEIMEEYRNKKLEKFRNAEIASVENMHKWNKQQEERVEKIRLHREHQQRELQKELELIEERRLLKRMEEVQAERDYMDELNAIEKEELEKENAELKQKIKIYQELNQKSEIALSDIKLTFPSPEDILNANNPDLKNISSDDIAVVDELNNVVEQKTFKTEAQENRTKMMSHKSDFSSNDNLNNNNNNDTEIQSLTDAQKNKLKVMGHEYNLIEEKKIQPVINVQDYDKMSDLQKNRLKVMSAEFEQIEYQQLAKKEKSSTCDNKIEMTDLQRNRQKVLSHEFGYDQEVWMGVRVKDKSDNKENLCDTKKELSLDLLKPEINKQALESPMSVTSDHFNIEFNDSGEKSSEDSANNELKQDQDENDDYEMMARAFEAAFVNNKINFMGISLNKSKQNYDELNGDIYKLDTMSLTHFLQTSLTLPLSAYMEVLNNEILKMYIRDLNVLSHFKSLRNYFLLMNGEYCSSICHEMFFKIENGTKPIELLNYHSLHMMLDQALSGSRFYDPNTDNLSFIVQNIPEKFELYSPSILNMLTLSYKVTWPLSLILNPETLDQYKAIFNYLIKLKRISFSLEQCIQLLKASCKQQGPEILTSHHYRNIQFIRHKMMQFISCLENYVTRNVIQTSWNMLIQDLKSADTFLSIYRKHTHYLKRILFLCLLTKNSHEFYKSIEDIFKVILKFHKHLKSKGWNKSSGKFIHENYDKILNDGHDFDRLLKYVMYLGNKIVQHGNQKEMYDLMQLIDINGYYSKNNN